MRLFFFESGATASIIAMKYTSKHVAEYGVVYVVLSDGTTGPIIKMRQILIDRTKILVSIAPNAERTLIVLEPISGMFTIYVGGYDPRDSDRLVQRILQANAYQTLSASTDLSATVAGFMA